ncbi:hypothetical protein H4Q26_006340 [Puccinia striiformis f. sp. tritici PST-130]|nr:hypothetical protein H4Q26_006340 [Puccinia striiformis f. sp. tritici PST-130]
MMYFSLLQIIYGALFLYLPIPNSASNRKTLIIHWFSTRGSSNALFSVTSSTVLLNSVHLNTITDHQSPFETPRQADPNNHQPGIPPNLTHPKCATQGLSNCITLPLYPLTHHYQSPSVVAFQNQNAPIKKQDRTTTKTHSNLRLSVTSEPKH